MAINVKPLGDRVLVQPLEEKEVKKGGIIIPDTAKEKPQEGTVVAVGTGKLDDNGKKIEFNAKVGDKVLISKVVDAWILLTGLRLCMTDAKSAARQTTVHLRQGTGSAGRLLARLLLGGLLEATNRIFNP